MHKAIGNMIKKEMGEGEKKAPLKSLSLKVKFQKSKGNVLDSKKKGSRE